MGRKRGRGEEKKGEKKKNFRKGKERWGEIWVLVVGYTCVLFVFQLFFMKLKGIVWIGGGVGVFFVVFLFFFVFFVFLCFSVIIPLVGGWWGLWGGFSGGLHHVALM